MRKMKAGEGAMRYHHARAYPPRWLLLQIHVIHPGIPGSEQTLTSSTYNYMLVMEQSFQLFQTCLTSIHYVLI